MSGRFWSAIALVAISIALERAGYYGLRAVLFLHLRESSVELRDVGSLFTLMLWVQVIASVIGGGIALALGARWTATLGAGVAAAGAMLYGLTDATFALLLFAAGAGIFRPSSWAAAAEIVYLEDDARAAALLDRLGSAARSAIFASIASASYGLVSITSFVGAPMGSAAFARGGIGATTTLTTIACLAAALAVGASAFTGPSPARAAAPPGPQGPYREGAAPLPAPPVDAPRAKAGVALLALASIPSMLALSASYLPNSRLPSGVAHSVGPLIEIALCLVAAVAWGLLASARKGPAPLLSWAVGTALLGGGALSIAYASGQDASLAGPHLVGLVLHGVGDALAGPIGLAYAVAATRGRGAALVVALFGLASSVGSMGALAMGSFSVLLTLGVTCLALGVAGAIFARALHARFFA